MLPPGIIAQGLVIGALGAFNSLGIILLWRTTRLINLAQPSIGLVGGVLTGLLVQSAGWSFLWAAPVGLAVGMLLGLATDRLALRRLQDAPRAVLLVATVGLAAIFSGIQTGLPFAIEGRPLTSYQIDVGFTLSIRPVIFGGAEFIVIALLPLAVFGTHWFMHRTRFGLSALALGQDQERAKALGVSSSTVRAAVWTVAGLLATVSGIFIIPVLGFSLGGGLNAEVLLFALAPAVLAGFRNLWGAVGGALALGVAHQTAFWYIGRSGITQLVLAGAVLLAVALQRRTVGRQEISVRASSWEAAATPRPLPWSMRSSTRLRAGTLVFSAGLVAAGTFAPSFLSASRQVTYANGAAVALCALSVAVAWMFAGEVALGQWGFAGLGAAVAAISPGAWPLRVVLGALAMTALGAILGVVSRRRSTLSFAVIGLAAATTGQVAVLAVSQRSVAPGFDELPVVAAVAGGLTLAAAVGIAWLRRSTRGSRIVAARDDPARGPWLGAYPARSRIGSLALSIGLAGLAGGLYAASSPVGFVAGSSTVIGAFDFSRSLDLLTMAVVGGLGSPAGAVIGSVAITAGRTLLPGAWVFIVSGVGIMLVVIFQPAGLSRILSWMRLTIARFVSGQAIAAAPEETIEAAV